MRNPIDNEAMARDPAERELLRLARDPSIQRLELVLRDGRLDRGYATRELEITEAEALPDLLKAEPFQTIELVRHGGTTQRIVRKTPIKFNRPDRVAKPGG